MTVMMIRVLAKDMAGDFWEQNHSERFRTVWGNDVKRFIDRNWPTYVEEARSVLAGMLARKDVPESQKVSIHAALVEDRRRSLRHKGVKVGIGPLKLRPDQPGRLEQQLFHKD